MAVLDRADALLPILEISVYFRAIRIDPAATVRSEYGHTTKPTTLSLFDEADLPGSGGIRLLPAAKNPAWPDGGRLEGNSTIEVADRHEIRHLTGSFS